MGARAARGVARAQLREVVYRLVPESDKPVTRLSLLLSQAAPGAIIETTVTHLDDEGDVWRTIGVQGRPAEVTAVRKAFEAYEPNFLVEKDVLGATARRLILWYKYRPELLAGMSHTRLAFRLLGRDTVLTDRATGGVLTLRVLARAGPGLREFLREVRCASGAAFELLYAGPLRDATYARLNPGEEETLRAAHTLGYFDVPGRVGIREVAKDVGISASAASYRLRRAQAKLVDAYLE